MTDIWQRTWNYPTDEEIDGQIELAKQVPSDTSCVIKSVIYNSINHVIVITLINKTQIIFNPDIINAMKGADKHKLGDVWFSVDAIGWDQLDFSIHTIDLIDLVCNTNKVN
jgi:hypothetical protein